MSGVACSCHPSTSAPYYVVNWVENSDTDLVTSGAKGTLRTWYGARYSDRARPPSAPIAGVLALLSELRALTATPGLDVEFAVSAQDELILLQVRPLVAGSSRLPEARHAAELTAITRGITERERSELGSRTVYGVMPDWNPAEMIGLHPRPLALSLYRSLITDRTWARARHGYGYRDVRGVPLLVDFGGLPYIDVRASAASLVPADVPGDLAVRLVDRAVDTLAENPHLHDKIESEILVAAHGFHAEQRIERLMESTLDDAERRQLKACLHGLTDRLVTGDLVHQDLARLRRLDDREPEPGAADGAALRGQLDRCVEYGTLPFAGLARAAFVATELLDDLVAEGVFSPEDKAAFVAGLGLVSGELRRDFNVLQPDAFLKRYGHLRPGTYDILSPRYDEQPDTYFDWSVPRDDVPTPPELRLTGRQRQGIAELIEQAGFSFDTDRLLDFIGTAIRGREQAKFDFTRVLSDLLATIRQLGDRLGLTAEQMSYVDIGTLCALTGDRRHDTELLTRASAAGETSHGVSQLISLPPLVTGPQDVWSFQSRDVRPNFVTQGRAIGRVANIDDGDAPEGAIAMIASADPGYDWLFARGISGLVTAFGGVNSHMALRALELGVPAVIGAGESQFRLWSRAAGLDIDAASELVAVLT
jgi:phosphohistidine swiveling domain-containing protein